MNGRAGKIWRIGLVGTGYYSAVHFNAWSAMPNVSIRAICDLDQEKLECCGRVHGIAKEKQYTDYEAMLNQAELDAVDIATRPEAHLSLVRLAARAKKHIICQKPFAPSVREAEAMIAAVKENGVRLMVRENWRWLQPYRQLKRMLDEEAVGKIRAVRYVLHSCWTPHMRPGYPMDQPYFREMPKLLFYEMGAHWFDVWHCLFGKPKRLFASMRTISPHIQGEDCGFAVLEHDGFSGLLDMSWASLDDQSGEQMLIEGENGSLKLYPTQKTAPGEIAFFHPDGRKELLQSAVAFDPGESHRLLQQHFLSGLESGRPFATDAVQNVEVLKMVFAAYESHRTKQPVTL